MLPPLVVCGKGWSRHSLSSLLASPAGNTAPGKYPRKGASFKRRMAEGDPVVLHCFQP